MITASFSGIGTTELVGLIGAILILLAWVWETTSEVKKHKVLMDLRFSFLSIVGTVLITIYAKQVGNPIFFWLNLMITIAIVFEIWYSLHIKKVHRARE